jgi:hypothetical protein
LGNEYRAIAPLASIGSVVCALWLYGKLRTSLRNAYHIEQLGSYSVAIFLVNGIVRVPFIAFTRTLDSQLIMGLASAAVTIAVSVSLHRVMELAPMFAHAHRPANGETRIDPQPAQMGAD